MGIPSGVCSSSRKKWLFVKIAFGHGTPPFVTRIEKSRKCPRQESNLVLDLRRVACLPRTPRTPYCFERKARESNPDFRHATPVSSRWTISPCDSQSYSLSRPRSRISRSSFSLNRPLAFPFHRNAVHIVQRTFRRRFPAVLRRRFIVERRGIEPRLPGCKPSVFPLEQRPKIQEVRPGIEPGLPPYHSGVRPQHLQTSLSKVIPAEIEPTLSWMSAKRLRRWTTGSCQ